MSSELDCRGLACPLPVLQTKKALEQLTDEVLTVMVDNEVAKENVTKFASSQGCGFRVEQKGQEYSICITKVQTAIAARASLTEATAILFTQDKLGHGNEDLGTVLMKSFLYTLTQSSTLPKTLIFINAGVKLTVEGSVVLTFLQELSERKVEILSCGTCLDFYHLKDKLAVGEISNMYTIVTELATSGKTITL